ncbi:MAG: helix-turn-helix domain-containing protein [Pirellulales bacterium]|nr:helix-turn-helix domain-containing protein [Pirellulales bacterium]
MKKGSRTYVVDQPSQLRELASPVKQVILDALASAAGPCSIRELAKDVNRAADSLYYHLRSLVKSGLVIPAGTRTENGKPVALYTGAGRRFKIKYDFRIPRFKHLIRSIFRATIRLANRNFERGLDLDNVRFDPRHRNLYLMRMEAWLSRQHLAEVNQKINEINKILVDNCGPSEGER